MQQFKDRLGSEWQVRLNVGLLGQLRREAGLDLGQAMRSEQGLGEVLFADPETLIKALWVVCSEQAGQRGVSPDAFAYLFDGPAIESATEALLEAVTDFFPRSKIATALKRNLRATLEQMDESTVKRLDEALTSRDPAGNSGA